MPHIYIYGTSFCRNYKRLLSPCKTTQGKSRKGGIIGHEKKRNPIYDPRPVKYRKLDGHEDTFRNLCVTLHVSSLNYQFIEVYPMLI